MKLYEDEGIGRYISHIHRIGASFLSKEYEKYGIGSGQYLFLLQLYLKDGISHDELTEKVSVDKATTTRAIKKLETLGYVTTILNQQDKRKYYIHLTEKALEAREGILSISIKWEKKILGELSANETDALFSILRKICKHNSNYFSRYDRDNY